MDQTASTLDLRVILVGRTGLDAALRLDPTVELLRVRTSLEAIGELADPIDAASPAASVIVVGSDADPEAAPPSANGNGHTRLGGRAEFLRAVRLVDPAVKVFRVTGAAGPSDADLRQGYDGWIRADLSSQEVTDLLRGRSSNRAAPPTEVSPLPVSRPAPVPTEPGHAVSAGPAVRPTDSTAGTQAPALVGIGDAALVRVMLRGGDLSEPALALVRSRTADEGVQFVRAGQALPEAAMPVGVRAEGVVYGHLWSNRTLPEELALHADWLALWLRLAEQQAQLRDAAFTDPLTGAWNRRYFDRYLGAAIERARVARQPVTVMCFDIDDFKRFNDAFGHAAADEILIETVRLLRSVIRPSDRVCRVGGDEFAVIFHEPGGPRKPGSAPPATVFDIAQRFQEQICRSRFPKLGVEAPGVLTVSGGLATFPWDGTTPEELIRHADLLALDSKRAGKNAIVFGPRPRAE